MKTITMLMSMMTMTLFIYQMLCKHTQITLFLLIYMLRNTKMRQEMFTGVLKVCVAYVQKYYSEQVTNQMLAAWPPCSGMESQDRAAKQVLMISAGQD